MLDQDTGKSPLVYALIQAMSHAPSYGGTGGGGSGLGGIPLGSLMQMFNRQPGASAGGMDYGSTLPSTFYGSTVPPIGR